MEITVSKPVILLTALIILISLFPASARCKSLSTQIPSQAESSVLHNRDILRLFKAGIPADAIIAKIKHSRTDFDTSTDGLIALKAAKLPDTVIVAMIDATPAGVISGKTSASPSPGSSMSTVLAPSVPSEPDQSKDNSAEPRTSKLRAPETWEPRAGFAGQLYPAVILELEGSTLRFKKGIAAGYIGDPLGMAGVKIRCLKAGEHVTVTATVDGLSQPSSLEATLSNVGQYYYIFPVIRYDTAKLRAISESYPTTIEYSVSVEGKTDGQKTLTVQIHSVNDVPFAIEVHSGEPKNLKALFTGYVDENNSVVQKLLQVALSNHAVNQFDGYQSGEQGVEMQVFAIWNTLQRQHIHYSNTPTASAESPWGWVSVGIPDGRVISQTVRFLDQSIRDQQANCIDGTVLFASVLYKIGIDPLIVILPGHAFVGYFMDAQHRHPQFLETTLIGHGRMPLPLKFGPMYQIGATQSWKEFLSAVQTGNAEYNSKVRMHLGRDPRYMAIDVQKARETGINPIPRPQ